MFAKTEGGRAGFSGRVGKILLIGGLSVAALLILLEVGLRVYYALHPKQPASQPTLSAEPDYSYELVTLDHQVRISQTPGWIKLVLHPYLVYKNLPNQQTSLYNINSLGLRGDDVTPDKKADVYRIIVTGNSATFGIGASSDEHVLPYLLEQELNNSGAFPKRVEVWNAGVIGYLTSQESVYLAMDLIDLNPDLVVAYNGYTDFIWPTAQTWGCTKPLENPEQIGYQSLFYDVERTLVDHVKEANVSFPARGLALLSSLARQAFLGQFLLERLRGPDARARTDLRRAGAAYSGAAPEISTAYLLPDCVASIIDNYRSNLKRMADLATDWGVKMVLVVQPESGWKGQLSEDERQMRKMKMASDPWYQPAVTAIYPSFLETAREVAAQHHVGFLDLSHVFDGVADTVFIDSVHVNDSGNEILARALAQYLIDEEGNVQK
jgi:lysophospholipase L1-like esterase